ncbi:MAG: hypothetical protein AAF696_06225 [Bacteroidota bacterium]
MNPASLFFSSLCLLLFFPLLQGQGQQKLQQEIEENMGAFKFEESSLLLQKLEDADWRTFYSCNLIIYKFLSSQDPQYFEQLEDIWEQSREQLEKSTRRDSLKEIFLADLFGKRAVIAFLDHKYFQAIKYARLCYKNIESSKEIYGDHPEQMKIRGLFNALLGAIPKKYQWISKTLGFKGDIRKGRKQLEMAAYESKILRQEALLVLSFVEKNMLGEEEVALKRLSKLRKEKGPNIILDFTLASIRLSLKRNDKALEILNLRGYYDKEAIFFIPYWDYLLAKAHYYKESYSLSRIYFSRFVQTYKGKLFKGDAYFRLAMSLTLDGKYEQGKIYFKKIAYSEKEGLDEDEYAIYMAEKFAKNPPNLHETYLFRARNLFDGGYLDTALANLKKLEEQYVAALSLGERTELYYRYARIYQQAQDWETALSFFSRCIGLEESEQLWLQVYANYYSGQIKRNQGKLEEALSFFRAALSYKNYFYQTGLENRCKIALGETKREQKSQTSFKSR